jgi:hypothetical protein
VSSRMFAGCQRRSDGQKVADEQRDHLGGDGRFALEASESARQLIEPPEDPLIDQGMALGVEPAVQHFLDDRRFGAVTAACHPLEPFGNLVRQEDRIAFLEARRHGSHRSSGDHIIFVVEGARGSRRSIGMGYPVSLQEVRVGVAMHGRFLQRI